MRCKKGDIWWRYLSALVCSLQQHLGQAAAAQQLRTSLTMVRRSKKGPMGKGKPGVCVWGGEVVLGVLEECSVWCARACAARCRGSDRGRRGRAAGCRRSSGVPAVRSDLGAPPHL